MIHWNSGARPPLVQLDETSLNIGPRQQIEAYTWVDHAGDRHIVLHPTAEDVKTFPLNTKCVAFTVGWLFSWMCDAFDLDTLGAQEEKE